MSTNRKTEKEVLNTLSTPNEKHNKVLPDSNYPSNRQLLLLFLLERSNRLDKVENKLLLGAQDYYIHSLMHAQTHKTIPAAVRINLTNSSVAE